MSGRSADEISQKLGVVSQQAAATSVSMTRIAEQMKQNAAVTLDTRQAFQEISASVNELNEMASGYNDMMGAVRGANDSIQESTEHFAAVSEQSSATLQQLSATLETLHKQNLQMREHIRETDGKIKQMVQ
ncbi:methyl-accepting chemotaxis protein [Paenibacillus mesophilus]|uniref:methyl-accepting chemotaxis protein n=1 Tax=Paenibacillus mesophilus TaxID=2582849 RepID=UPI001305084C|nr:methyl-accepting chemotaxis protein [Paenibacillus mesophilus]